MTNCALTCAACAKKSPPAATSASAESPVTAIAIAPGPWPSRITPPATALPPAAASVDYPNRYLNRDPNRSLYRLSAIRSDQLLSEDQREQVKSTLRDRKRKAGTPDRPIFLWGVNEIV